MTTKQEEIDSNEAENIPEWINAKLFEEMLQKNVSNFKSIKDFKVQPAAAAGENYCTFILSIQIQLELQDGSSTAKAYIMKIPIKNEIMLKMKKYHNIFDVESNMYEQIVPEFEELYRIAGADSVQFGPKHYKLNTDNDYILLENLCMRGFKKANRLEGLDREHTKAMLKKLAQWHAASAVRFANKGMYDDMYAKAFYVAGGRQVVEFMNDTMAKAFLQCLHLYEGHEKYRAALEQTFEKLTDELYKYATADPSEFNVLNHGDCWTNNIMYQYNAEGKVRQTLLIDYQMCKYGSPAQDLIYFLLSSPKLELKLKEFEYLIRYYHEELVQHLKLLKYSKRLPSLKDIHIMIYKYGMWGLDTAAGVMSIALLDPNENASVETFLGESAESEAHKLLLYSNPRYRKHIEAILPWLYNRGALEY